MAENANDLQEQAAGNVAGGEESKNDFGIFPDYGDEESVWAGKDEHAPGVGHEGRRDAETDCVGEGIELHAKFRGGASHARDAAVERIEQDGKTYGFGRAVELVEAAHQ